MHSFLLPSCFNFRPSNFGIVSDFEIRSSDLFPCFFELRISPFVSDFDVRISNFSPND